MHKKYRVALSPEVREELTTLISKGRLATAANTHARILLKADAAPGAPAWTDEQISAAFEVSIRTIVRVRQAFVRGGLARAVHRRPPTGVRPRKIDGVAEAHLVALVCSDPPAGRERWTLQLLAERWVDLIAADTVSPETVRQTLKKTNLSRG